MGIHWKIRFLRGRGGGVFTENQYIGENCLKRGLGQFVHLRGKKEGGGVFEGKLIPQCTVWKHSQRKKENTSFVEADGDAVRSMTMFLWNP